MVATGATTAFRRTSHPWLSRCLCALAAAGGIVAALAPARSAEFGTDGLFITVPNPITETAVLQIENRIKDAVERQGRSLSLIVFDFNPHGKPSGTSNFFPCLQLKDTIKNLFHLSCQSAAENRRRLMLAKILKKGEDLTASLWHSSISSRRLDVTRATLWWIIRLRSP